MFRRPVHPAQAVGESSPVRPAVLKGKQGRAAQTRARCVIDELLLGSPGPDCVLPAGLGREQGWIAQEVGRIQAPTPFLISFKSANSGLEE